jgi:hypothetical protein
LIRKINALLQYHYKIDPAALTDEEWCTKWKELKWVLDFENKRLSENNKAVEL